MLVNDDHSLTSCRTGHRLLKGPRKKMRKRNPNATIIRITPQAIIHFSLYITKTIGPAINSVTSTFPYITKSYIEYPVTAGKVLLAASANFVKASILFEATNYSGDEFLYTYDDKGKDHRR